MTVGVLLLLLASSVEEETARGAALYSDARFEEALTVFKQLLDDPALAQTLGDPQRSRLYAWLGLSHAQLSSFEAAVDAFDAAVVLDPDVSLPTDAPATIVALLDDARARHAHPPLAHPAPHPAPHPARDGAPRSLTPPPASQPSDAAPLGRDNPAPSSGAVPFFVGAGISAAASVGTAVAGVAFGASALAARESAERARYQDAALTDLDTAQMHSNLANVLYVTSGVLLVAAGASAVGGVLCE